MTEYIIFTNEELEKMNNGESVPLYMRDGKYYVCCSEEHWKKIMDPQNLGYVEA